jgi:hypothetical protein
MKWAALLLPLASCAQLIGIEDPVGDTCSPFDVTTCAVTDTCDVDPTTFLFECRPEGDIGVGVRCDAGGTCAGALSCVDGICHSFCDAQHGCDPGDNESSCLYTLSDTATVCDNNCNVLDGSGCPNPGLQCVADFTNNLTLLCVPDGYFGNKPLGSLCSFLDECDHGLGCDTEGSSTCVPYCDVANPTTCATTCVELGRVHESLDLGLCRP